MNIQATEREPLCYLISAGTCRVDVADIVDKSEINVKHFST